MRNFLSKEHSQRKAEHIIPPVESYLVGKGGFFAGTLVVDGLVADAFGDVVQSDVVPEIEENAGNGYGNAGGEADVQRVEFFFNIPLVEIIKVTLLCLSHM